MIISDKEVERVAELARLALTPEEKSIMAEQLGKIIGYMDKLNQLDTKDVPPTSYVLPMQNVFRQDEVTGLFKGRDLMLNAPQWDKGHYKVPRIIG